MSGEESNTETGSTDEALDKARLVAEALVDDYHRQGKHLEQAQVERVLDRRGLDAEQCHYVYEHLEKQGIDIALPVEDEPDVEDLLDMDDPDDADVGSADRKSANRKGGPVTAWILTVAGAEPLLTAQEEVELGRRIALGRLFELGHDALRHHSDSVAREAIARGEQARVRMILSNLRLVVNIAKRYVAGSGLDLDDLVQEGVVGLMSAVEKFDHNLGYRFSTYATWWIQQGVTRAIANTGRTVRFPAHIDIKVRQLKRAVRWLWRINDGRPPTLSELEEELQWDRAKIKAIWDLAGSHAVSIFEGDDTDERKALIDTLVSDEPGPATLAEIDERVKYAHELLAKLKPNEREILSLRFDLGHTKTGEWTLELVGQKLGVTRERIRQIQSKAMAKLKREVARQERGTETGGRSAVTATESP